MLIVKDLKLSFKTRNGMIPILKGLNFSIKKSESVALVGESGSGKSLTAQSIMGLIPTPPGVFESGEIWFDGEELLSKSAQEMQKVRGNKIGIVFQDPMSSLNPMMRIGTQIIEAIKMHRKAPYKDLYKRALELLQLVEISDPEKRMEQYPHQFSGGMRQRAMIAIAIACEPKLLIADEPTTALDVTIQAQILDLLKQIQAKTGMSILLITHDLGIVAGLSDRVLVMQEGTIVEEAPVTLLFATPKHPYTQKLLNALPKEAPVVKKKQKEPFIQISSLSKTYRLEKKDLQAVHEITLSIYRGETLGLVGESGCGKSSLGRAILRLDTIPSSGKILFDGVDLQQLSTKELKRMRRRLQVIFQDPYASLNPRMTVDELIGEPLEIHRYGTKKERKERIKELLQLVGLRADHISRFPHQFSGGQRQRIVIARALAVEPEFIVCDEPLSSLDVSIQTQIIQLLKTLQEEMGLTYLFIAHDLAMVKSISDRVAVMYLGHLMEIAETQELYQSPLHPYTQALLSAIPIPNPIEEKKRTRILLKGELPNPLDPPKGCPFSTRCPMAKSECFHVRPKLRKIHNEHFAACHFL